MLHLPWTTPVCHNVSCHTSLAQRQFVTMCPVTTPLHNTSLSQCVLSHLPRTTPVCHIEPHFSHTNPPYYPELNPCDLCLLSRLKIGPKFRRFASLRDIQQQATAGPTAIACEMSYSSSTNGSRAVDSVCVCVFVCVWRNSTVFDCPRVCTHHALYTLC